MKHKITAKKEENMKVLMLNGSPKANGNTYTALLEIGKQLEKEGISYEIVQIGGKPVRDCIGCGKCRDACPAGNIALDCSSRPVWGPNCLSCTACYHICPRKAIAYGNITKSKGQYHFRN